VRSTNYAVLRYALSSSPLLLLPFRPKYFPQLPVLEHPQPLSSLNVTDQVSHPYKTAGTFTLYVNFSLSGSIVEDKRPKLDGSRNFLNFIYS
jgi:hypothetical protein